jgi:hypothetical protein
MIDDEAKNKLIIELEKSGNVYLSCLKVNINRATYYRWAKSDKKFRIRANQAVRLGRENACEIAEHALILNAKNGIMDAIKYVLSHNSPRYKPDKTSTVIFDHKKSEENVTKRDPTLKEVIDYTNEKLTRTYLNLNELDKAANETLEARANKLKEKYEPMGGIPPKADGSEIKPEELLYYQTYIEEWYKKKWIEENKPGN